MNSFLFWSAGDQALIWTVNVVLQLTLVVGVSLMIGVLLRRHCVARHWVLCCGLMLALVIPAMAGVMQWFGAGLLPVEVADHPPVAARADEPRPTDDPSTVQPIVEPDEVERAPSSVRQSPVNRAQPAIMNSAANSPDTSWASRAPAHSWRRIIRHWMPTVFAIWLIGAAILLMRLVIAWARLGAILRTASPNTDLALANAFAAAAKPHAVELVISDQLSGPVAAGIWRPRVVLPAALIGNLDPKQTQHILAHELAHVARRDQLVVLLQNLVGAIYWMHPLTSLFNRQLAQAREEVCDNHVIAHSDALSYSRTLLALTQLMQTPRPVPGTVGLFCSQWRLEHRVACLLDKRSSHATPDVAQPNSGDHHIFGAGRFGVGQHDASGCQSACH